MAVDPKAVAETLAALRAQNDAHNWGWYFSRDEEVYYGPYGSREDAEAEGKANYGDDPFFVAECHNGPLHVTIFSDLAERLDEANEDTAQEDTYPSEQVSGEQWLELERALNAVMGEWCARHNLTQWAFDQIRDKTRHDPRAT